MHITLMHMKMDSSKLASINFFKSKQMMLIIHRLDYYFLLHFHVDNFHITNLLGFIGSYKFCVKSNFHRFIGKLHSFI